MEQMGTTWLNWDVGSGNKRTGNTLVKAPLSLSADLTRLFVSNSQTSSWRFEGSEQHHTNEGNGIDVTANS